MRKNEDRLKRLASLSVMGLFCLLFVFLTGCEKKKEVKRAAPVAAPKVVKKKVVVEEKEVKKEVPVYKFDAEGKRDPFKSFIKKPKIEIVKPTVPLTPLQEYDVTQLKLTGIITGTGAVSENRAMVSDPTGKGYILKKGTLIGKNFGRVARIERSKVIIIEDVQDFLGNIITKEIPLTLETEGGE
jgi:type IV pilus assembly protein PilP